MFKTDIFLEVTSRWGDRWVGLGAGSWVELGAGSGVRLLVGLGLVAGRG